MISFFRNIGNFFSQGRRDSELFYLPEERGDNTIQIAAVIIVIVLIAALTFIFTRKK